MAARPLGRFQLDAASSGSSSSRDHRGGGALPRERAVVAFDAWEELVTAAQGGRVAHHVKVTSRCIARLRRLVPKDVANSSAERVLDALRAAQTRGELKVLRRCGGGDLRRDVHSEASLIHHTRVKMANGRIGLGSGRCVLSLEFRTPVLPHNCTRLLRIARAIL